MCPPLCTSSMRAVHLLGPKLSNVLKKLTEQLSQLSLSIHELNQHRPYLDTGYPDRIERVRPFRNHHFEQN